MTRLLTVVLSALTLLTALGCDLNSYFDPSRTGRFEYTPTTIPVLDRLDVIEHDRDPWAKATAPTPEDLIPSDLTYRIAPADFVTIETFELIIQGQIWGTTRPVSASGYFRLPVPLGDVRAAGLTAQEFQDEVYRLVDELVMPNPLVNVTVEEGATAEAMVRVVMERLDLEEPEELEIKAAELAATTSEPDAETVIERRDLDPTEPSAREEATPAPSAPRP